MTESEKFLEAKGVNLDYANGIDVILNPNKPQTIPELMEEFSKKQVEKMQSLKMPLSVREQELLTKYSEFLAERNYIDSDWWSEHPKAIDSFIAELGE